MLRKGQEGHVRAERDVLKGAAQITSPGEAQWIVKMYSSFQDRDHLYLVRLLFFNVDLSGANNSLGVYRYWSICLAVIF